MLALIGCNCSLIDQSPHMVNSKKKRSRARYRLTSYPIVFRHVFCNEDDTQHVHPTCIYPAIGKDFSDDAKSKAQGTTSPFFSIAILQIIYMFNFCMRHPVTVSSLEAFVGLFNDNDLKGKEQEDQRATLVASLQPVVKDFSSICRSPKKFVMQLNTVLNRFPIFKGYLSMWDDVSSFFAYRPVLNC